MSFTSACGGSGRSIQRVLTRAIDKIRGATAFSSTSWACSANHLNLTRPGTYFQQSSAGALGFGLGAALGAKLAAPDRFVIAAVGDGSYMFGNPTPAHFISRACRLPVLFVITNNSGWASVRSETESMYPGGENRRANRLPLAVSSPHPNIERVIEASGGYGVRVEAPEQLDPALERAAHVVQSRKAAGARQRHLPHGALSGTEYCRGSRRHCATKPGA